MKYIFVVLSVVLVVTAFLYTRLTEEAVVVNSEPTTQHSEVEESVSSIDKIPKVLDHPAVDWESINNRLNFEVQSFTKEEEAAFNALHVLPLNWVVQKDCRTPNDCELIWEYPPTAYHTMDMIELEEQAYDNPLAALMMGIRITEEPSVKTGLSTKERTNWFFRASALSGKTGPLMRLTGYGIDSSTNDAPKLSVAQQAAIQHIAQMLGDQRTGIQESYAEIDLYWKENSRNDEEYKQSVSMSKNQIYYLYQNNLEYMEEVQRTVTGSNQILKQFAAEGGAPDA